MNNLIVLIDPNDNNLQDLISEVNTLKPGNLWVGCSTSSGEDVRSVFGNLEVPASLYPGNFDQIKLSHSFAEKVFVSDPLFFNSPDIPNLLEDIQFYGRNEFSSKMELMNYLLLHPNCSAARILRVTESYTDEQVVQALNESTVHPTIYLEGGSRNRDHPISERRYLLQRVRDTYVDSRIICGGGIGSFEQIKTLKDLGVDVLVSNLVHENPSNLEECMRLFE